MPIDKAIEILEYNLAELTKGVDPDSERAFRLGIEALKEVQRIRSHKDFDATIYLPGETTD